MQSKVLGPIIVNVHVHIGMSPLIIGSVRFLHWYSPTIHNSHIFFRTIAGFLRNFLYLVHNILQGKLIAALKVIQCSVQWNESICCQISDKFEMNSFALTTDKYIINITIHAFFNDRDTNYEMLLNVQKLNSQATNQTRARILIFGCSVSIILG